MGAGASTGKGKKAPSGAKQLAKAQESAEEAKALFDKIDVNKDGKLSVAELKDSVKKYGKDVKANWTDPLILEVVQFFDRDGDGMLDIDEFGNHARAHAPPPHTPPPRAPSPNSTAPSHRGACALHGAPSLTAAREGCIVRSAARRTGLRLRW